MSAVSTALAVSGFSDKYFFYGFFDKIKTLNEDLDILSNLNCSIIFLYHQKKSIK